MARDPILALARSALGFRRLRPGQREAVRALLDGRDVLAVLPTGSGKSAIYQLAALRIPGPTVVVSPLVALQRDQVEAIARRRLAGGAGQANATIPAGERRQAIEDFSAGDLEFLFLAPEQLARSETLEQVVAARPSLLVVDEAHCISTWGHDFRPEYGRLGELREAMGRPLAVALTATAAPPVRREIIERLGLRDPVVVVRGFDRPNIHLAVERFSEADAKDDALVARVAAGDGGPGIIYAATRARTGELAGRLAGAGVDAVAYHAGLRAADRRAAQEAFMAGARTVIVATTAFGMGIDKPDVRFVLHADAPDSLDAYHQELGRAGRDGKPADAVLFYRPEDLGLRRFFAGGARVGPGQLEAVARALADGHDPSDDAGLREATGLSPSRLEAARNLLDRAGGQVAAAAALAADDHRVEQSRIEMLRGYAEDDACRRELLLTYFGEPFEPPCGACDNCEAGLSAEDRPAPDELPFEVDSRVRHKAWGPGRVLRYDGDRMVVLFDRAGYRTLSVTTVLQRRLLRAR
jgi:ATP-dependent DNA helicase RecQ